ncbi:DoxX family protein [Flavobacterium coralii]|uniref:DoxX family protein n=1 Tax=Flavobacterium coralii TaxID=2838017 RepID=UPI002692E53E
MNTPILRCVPSRTTIIIRIMVGVVFLSEGLQKLIIPEVRGAERFRAIGLPAPEFLGHLVGCTEIVCGLLILSGFLTRLAAIPLMIIMLTAFAATKADIYVNEGFWGFMHQSRTDWAMFWGCIFLFIKGGGRWSLDNKIAGV